MGARSPLWRPTSTRRNTEPLWPRVSSRSPPTAAGLKEVSARLERLAGNQELAWRWFACTLLAEELVGRTNPSITQ